MRGVGDGGIITLHVALTSAGDPRDKADLEDEGGIRRHEQRHADNDEQQDADDPDRLHALSRR